MQALSEEEKASMAVTEPMSKEEMDKPMGAVSLGPAPKAKNADPPVAKSQLEPVATMSTTSLSGAPPLSLDDFMKRPSTDAPNLPKGLDDFMKPQQ